MEKKLFVLFTDVRFHVILMLMNERFEKVLFASADVASLAAFAVAGACFAFSAGGHEVYAETAHTVEVKHHEKDLRNDNLIPAVLFEGLVVAKAISLARRKKSNQEL